jgi:hypothetical protein
MPHQGVEPVGDELVFVANFEGGGPVPSEVGVRLVEQPQSHYEPDGADDEVRWMKRIVREREGR